MFNKFKKDQNLRHQNDNLYQWENYAESRIKELASQQTPLNDWFASGNRIISEDLLCYIAALEQRIYKLELYISLELSED